MGAELRLSYADVAELENDFESNLRKGRAFVQGAWGVGEREACTLRIEHPRGGAALCLQAEAVWIDENRENGGTGVQLLSFGADLRETLKSFVGAGAPAPQASGERPAADRQLESGEPGSSEPESSEPESSEPGSGGDALAPESASAPLLHERIRGLSISEREVVARQGSLPERVALERRFGGSVWEGLLHNPQLTPREVLRMAKSASLPTSLVNLIVANKAWLADSALQAALLHNPRVSGAHLDRVLRALPQSELVRISGQTSLRLQVRQGAKRLIRR